MKVKKAVITAAGWGTRFLPLTKSQPKEMLPLLSKPLIQYSVEEAVACGAELVVIVTSQGKKSIEDHFDRHFELEHILEQKGDLKSLEEIRRLSSMAEICYVRQKEQRGLGHAVMMTREVIGNEPFMLFLPDDIFEFGETVLRNMLKVHQERESSVIAVSRVNDADVCRYGIVDPEPVTDRVSKIRELVEKPPQNTAPSNLAIMGRYILTPDVFQALAETPPGSGGEIQLTDALQRMIRESGIYSYEFEGKRYDTGTFPGWLETTVEMALKDPEIGPGFRDYITSLFRE